HSFLSKRTIRLMQHVGDFGNGVVFPYETVSCGGARPVAMFYTGKQEFSRPNSSHESIRPQPESLYPNRPPRLACEWRRNLWRVPAWGSRGACACLRLPPNQPAPVT